MDKILNLNILYAYHLRYFHVTLTSIVESTAQAICNKVSDYHKGKVTFDSNHVIKWVSQFDNSDQQFILEEFLHILNQNTYLNEIKARKILINHLTILATHYKFKSLKDFLQHVDFLHMQKDYKSQTFILKILNEELNNKFAMSLSECGNKSKKYAIYLDDILATGGTVCEHSKEWLNIKNDDGNTNLQKILNDDKILIFSLFCKSTWGVFNVKWRLKYDFNCDSLMKKIKFQSDYVIENHPTVPGQKYNCIYPIKENQPDEVLKYFENLDAESKAECAFRKINTPSNESFFSSSKNRVRFENILLNKGIELLKIPKTLKKNHRPLGVTNPTKKILGTGTLYFTWRNISNTTPIVFWWKVSWYPLFELDNRGIE